MNGFLLIMNFQVKFVSIKIYTVTARIFDVTFITFKVVVSRQNYNATANNNNNSIFA